MKCIVLNCPNASKSNSKTDNEVTFHMFPKDVSQRVAWREALSLNNWEVKESSLICSDHFRAEDFYDMAGCRTIKKGALPIMNSAHNLDAPAASLVCRVCLATNVRLYDVNEHNMNNYYMQLIGIYIIDHRLPQKLCWECAHKLKLYQNFRNKATKSRDLLLSVVGSSQYLTLKCVRSIDRTLHGLKSNLTNTTTSQIDITIKSELEIDSNQEIKNEITIQIEDNEMKNEINELYVNNDIDNNIDDNIDDFNDSDDDKLLIDIRQDTDRPKKRSKRVKLKKKKLKESCDEKIETDNHNILEVKRRRKNDIDPNLFTIQPLSYEEQIREIASRQDSSGYKNAPFKCTACYRGFAFKERYDAHVVRHTEQSGAYECFVCKTRLKTSRALRKHITGQHTEQYICKGCPFVTRTRGVAREHEKWHSGSRYQCPHCPSQFDKHTTYMGHVRIKHASDFVCSLCGFTFVSKKGVEVHVKKKHRLANINVPLEGPYCTVCDITFINEEAHERHLKLSSKHSSEHDPDRIRNDSQSVRVDRARNDRRHTVQNTEETMDQTITCEQCGVELRDLRIYAQHFRRAHPDKNRTKYPAMKTPAMCELCGRIFQSMALLKDHMWVHTGVKRFQCSLCDKSFTQKTNLILHMRAHSDTRPSYPCHVCGKRFLFHNNRRRHMFIHTGLKPHSCSTCGKCFTTMGELKAHVAHVHLKKPWPRRAKHHQKPSISDGME